MQITASDYCNMLHAQSRLDGVNTCTSFKLVHILSLEYELWHQRLPQICHTWYSMLVSSMYWNRCRDLVMNNLSHLAKIQQLLLWA